MYDTHTQEVNYTVCKPVYETHSKVINYTVMKPVYETHSKVINYTVCKPVYETHEGHQLHRSEACLLKLVSELSTTPL